MSKKQKELPVEPTPALAPMTELTSTPAPTSIDPIAVLVAAKSFDVGLAKLIFDLHAVDGVLNFSEFAVKYNLSTNQKKQIINCFVAARLKIGTGNPVFVRGFQ